MKDLKTVVSAPTKEEAERMVKVAYYLDKNFLRPLDFVDFGIEVYRLKECGEVRMSKSHAKIKPHAAKLWGRMTKPMQAMFLWSHFCELVDEMRLIYQELRELGEPTQDGRLQLDAVIAKTAAMLPKELQEKIKEGFGRDWR